MARETAKQRSPGGERRRFRAIVGTDAHSSIRDTLCLLEMDPLVVACGDHQLTGGAYSEAIETAPRLAGQAAAEIASRDYLELIREPDLPVVLFRRRGWSAADYTAWADRLLEDQIAFVPPSAWEGKTAARFAFPHPHTSMELVNQILDRMA